MSDHTRLFIGLPLPEAIRNKFSTFDLSSKGLRKVPLKNLHLTLKFIGDVDESLKESIQAELRNISVSSFSLAFEGLGKFPKRGKARVLWSGLKRVPPELIHLHEQIEDRLESRGIQKEDRRFSPHLTLARVKPGFKHPVEDWIEKYKSFQTEEFQVNEFILFASELTPKGSIYTVVGAYPLK